MTQEDIIELQNTYDKAHEGRNGKGDDNTWADSIVAGSQVSLSF